MKRFVAFFIAALISCALFAQEYVPTVDEVRQFFRTKTLVVLDDNPMSSYNFEIEEIVKSEWDVTDFEIIDNSEFEEKRVDPTYSFLIMSRVNFSKDKTNSNYQFLHLLLGGSYGSISQMPSLVSIPVSFEGVEESSYMYKLNSLVRWMQNHVKLISENPDLISNNIFNYYKDNVDSIGDKILYLTKEEISPEVDTRRRIENVYPHKFKIVTKEEVKKAIENRNPNVIYLHKVGPEGTKLRARCYKVVLGADEPTLYYFDYHMIDEKKPDGFLEKDFKRMAKGKSSFLF